MAKLEKMSREDLEREKAAAEKLLKEIGKAQAEYDGRRLKELRAEIEVMLAKEGFTLSDLFDGKSVRKSGGKAKAAPKYKHPENGTVTWSGRGRQPQWFKDHVNGGGKAEDLAI
ncbi:MAG: H-NS histone family protein [Jannaschia sp.]